LAKLRPILIVDDDANFRALVVALLARAGFATIIEAPTGEESLAVARAVRPTLILLDVFLPDMSGFEICRTLRDEFGDDLPIIFVSGERVEPADRAVGLLVGGDDYIVKPFDPDEFLARVRRAVDRSRREPTGRATASHVFDLTRREREVLERLAQGLSQSDIAAALVISPKTVASHVQRILAKLGVHSRAQAVAVAYQYGVIRGPTGTPEGEAALETPSPPAASSTRGNSPKLRG
jgi:DNA-binding NarL/FixJ family response regulator